MFRLPRPAAFAAGLLPAAPVLAPVFGGPARADDAKLKEGLKLFWFAIGKDDFLVETSRKTVEMFKAHKFDVTYEETDGAHTWDKWRDYLNEFAPQLFR